MNEPASMRQLELGDSPKMAFYTMHFRGWPSVKWPSGDSPRGSEFFGWYIMPLEVVDVPLLFVEPLDILSNRMKIQH